MKKIRKTWKFQKIWKIRMIRKIQAGTADRPKKKTAGSLRGV